MIVYKPVGTLKIESLKCMLDDLLEEWSIDKECDCADIIINKIFESGVELCYRPEEEKE